jgi:hypothetical protein
MSADMGMGMDMGGMDMNPGMHPGMNMNQESTSDPSNSSMSMSMGMDPTCKVGHCASRSTMSCTAYPIDPIDVHAVELVHHRFLFHQ